MKSKLVTLMCGEQMLLNQNSSPTPAADFFETLHTTFPLFESLKKIGKRLTLLTFLMLEAWNVKAQLTYGYATYPYALGVAVSGNVLRGQKINVPVTTLITHIGINAEEAEHINLSIYSDNANAPDALLAQTGVLLFFAGRNRLPLTAPINLPAGDYWVMGTNGPNSYTAIGASDTDGTLTYTKEHTYTNALPANFGTGFTYTDRRLSIYLYGTVFVWTGNISTDWAVPGNWQSGSVPTATDDVLIPNVANDPIIMAGTSALAKSVTVQSGALLTIAANGSLAIHGFIPIPGPRSPRLTTALYNVGTVTNNGTLNVGTTSSAGTVGITNQNTFNNNAGGRVSINNTNEQAFWNTSNTTTMTNAGILEIGGIAAVIEGIVNQGSFTNTLSGQISINNAVQRGISNFAAPGFTNYGAITIGAIGNVGEAIRNAAAPFDNSGCTAVIKILSNSIIFNTGSPAPLNFNNSGIIIENATGTSNITNNTGVVQNLNDGTFTITTNTGVLTTATGDIWTGCTSTNWATATNWLDGSVPTASDDVTIPNVTNDPIIGAAAVAKSVTVQSGAVLTNNSTLTINGSTTQGMLNNGTLQNNGTLNIGNTSSVGQYGLYNQATFNNNGGHITIDRSTFAGIINQGTTFNNAGVLTIGSVASVGLYGLQNNDNGTFNNNAGGEIKIDRSTTTGLDINTGNFTNWSKITIGAAGSVGSQGINNAGTFNNNGCSSLINVVSNNIISNTGTFNNAGIIVENAGSTSNITNNTGVVQNLNGGTFTIGSGNQAIASAGDIWTGCVSTDWATAGNWLDGTVPTATDNITIPNLTNDPTIAGSTAALAKSVVTQSGSFLTINAMGGLTINGSTGNGLDNSGSVDNSGSIIVGNSSAIGAIGIVHRNGGTFNNKPGGVIQIDRTGGNQAFYTSGVVNNEATIEIGSNAAVTGQGLNIESGTGIFNNKTNSLLTINGSSVFGMENKGTLDNSGTIRIGNSSPVGQICIVHRSGGTFNNKTGGAIYMDGTTAGEQAFYSSGAVNNKGSIIIGSAATINGEGIQIANGTFDNEALIEIGSQSDVKKHGIINLSTFNNKVGGDIRINRVGTSGINGLTCILNAGTFKNEANITIGNGVLLHGQDGIYNIGNFINNSAGIISIAKPWGNGVWHISGTFQNDGQITISNVFNTATGNFGTGILSTGPFTNSTNAQIHIDQVANGIANTNNFTNAGLIRMGENAPLTRSGIINIQGANAVFNNNAEGDISIKQTAVDGVQNDVNSSFFNNVCARLTILDNLNNNGTFTNAGLFTVNTTQAHTNSALTNNGLIEYPQGNPIPNVTNNDLVVAPITVCGTTISPTLQIGDMNNFTVGNTWYTDASLMTQAGTYNQGTNTFMLTDLALLGTKTMYFSVNDAGNPCPRTVSVKVTINPLPTVTISGNNSPICAGANAVFTLTGTPGAIVSYNLNAGSPAQVTLTGGTATITVNTALSNQTLNLISITDGTCSKNLTANSTVTVNPLPTASILNNSSPFCAGANASFTLSGTNGATLTYTLTGLAGNQTLLLDGANQTITANNAANDITLTLLSVTKNNCPVMLSATATVTVYPLPTDFALSGGGVSFCQTPLSIVTAGSQSGVSYQLKRNNVNLGSPIQGTGNPLSFSGLTQAGTYSVVATTAVGNCSRTLSDQITIQTRNAPTAYNLSGGGASCSGTPVSIILSNSQIGVLYQLKRANNPVGSPVPGTGNALSFPPQNTPGNYTVVALTQCADLAMNNTVSITSIVTPSTFTLTGGGISCGTALPVGLSDSQSGVFYQLYRNGSSVGTTVQGTGQAITLGNHLTQGQYTIVATRAGECATTMSGSALIELIDPPALFTVTGGGAACPAGVTISLSGSQNGIQYQLKRGNMLVSTLPGTGNPLFFPNQTVAGTYTVEAISEGNCTRTMSGNAIVTVAGTLPNIYSMTGGGTFCNNVPVALGLSDSQKNVSYQLQRNTSSGFVNVGTGVQGTGSALALGTHSILGEYRVMVHSACVTEMTGRKSITACNARAAVEESLESVDFVQVIPNPVSNTLHLKVSEAKGQKINVNLLDASGRILLKRSFTPESNQHREEFEVSQLSNGMYFMQVKTADKQATLKVVKVQ